MTQSDLRTQHLRDGILREPVLDTQALALWLPGQADSAFHYWERIGSVAGGKVESKHGIRTAPALSIRARRRRLGLLGKLLWRFQGDGQALVLPNGDSVEQCGERQSNLLLAWPETETTAVDEAAIRAHWPACEQVERLGQNLFVIRGLPLAQPAVEPTADGPPREIAEKALASARQAGDRVKECAALTDLGLLALNAVEAPQALTLLQDALAILEQSTDRSREGDVRGALGTACLATGDLPRAAELFRRERELAQEPFAIKLALEHLGMLHARQQDLPTALRLFQEALALARQVGDRRQETTLLWHLAILHGELGQRMLAITHAEASLDLMRRQGKPEVGWYSDHLSRYRAETTNSLPAAGSFVTGVSGQPAPGPSLLRMAVTATKAMAQFIGSGGRRVTPEMREARLRACANCEHHTGLRCRLCGCFTHTKSWLPYEDCPASKWPKADV